MNVGFSGTRKGMTGSQLAAFARLLESVRNFNQEQELWFNHGDCQGSDEEAHNLAKAYGYKVRLHPPDNPNLRAFCKADETEFPEMYSIRNGNIVRISELVIATPSGRAEIFRGSGTWQVIRAARKSRPKKPYVIIYPDGEQEGRDWERFIH